MWAHYAQKHSGVSICFDYSKYDAEELVYLGKEYSYLIPFRVKYIKRFDKIRLNKNRIYSDWLLYKSNIWSYEKEVRMIMENEKVVDKHLDLPFPKNLLSKIIFGANTSQNVKKEIIELAVQEFYTIEFEEMYIDFDLKIKSRKISIDKLL